MSPADYRALAVKAKSEALDYRAEAETAPEPRKSILLKWADQRQADADFYASRAEIHADFERQHMSLEVAA